MNLAFVTCREYPELTPDDRAVVPTLAGAGFAVTPVVWDDPAAAWDGFDAILVRSPWDYYQVPGAFPAWLDARASGRAPLLNPPEVLRWNLDKFYLRDLEARGVPVLPTRFVARGSATPLAEVLDGEGWDEAVVKPSFSAGGWRTSRVTRAAAGDAEPAFRALAREGGVLVQRFAPEILGDGEWTLVFYGGAYSHAVRKTGAPGEFRIHEEHGGAVHEAVAPPALVEAATCAVRAAEDASGVAPFLYARVDGVLAPDGFRLMELEALEPELFFRRDPAAPARFLAALRPALAAVSA